MLLINQRCASSDHCDERLVLPFELRQKSRLRTRLESGEEVGLFLERGTILRDGDTLMADDGRVVLIVAAPESVLLVRCATTQALVRAAYHLGNRHIPLQIGAGWLRLGYDHVLREMLLDLGVEVSEENAPFEPEAGAYGGGHRRGDEDRPQSLLQEWTALNE